MDPSYSVVYQVQQNALLIIAASWVVLIIFIFNVLINDTMKDLTAFFIILLASLPVVLVNAGWWAGSVLVFVVFYRMAVMFQRLFR